MQTRPGHIHHCGRASSAHSTVSTAAASAVTSANVSHSVRVITPARDRRSAVAVPSSGTSTKIGATSANTRQTATTTAATTSSAPTMNAWTPGMSRVSAPSRMAFTNGTPTRTNSTNAR